MIRALEPLQLVKGTSRNEVTLSSEEVKDVAIAIIELCLSEGINQPVSQSVSQ